MVADKWKVCALCRFLQVLDQGQEIEEVLDTEYNLFYCARLGEVRYESSLMVPADEDIADSGREARCPYWEPWSCDLEGARQKFVGLPEAQDLEDDPRLQAVWRELLPSDLDITPPRQG